MFIRFAVGTESQDPREMHGPFTEAEHLRTTEALKPYEAEQVSEVFRWFNNELPCPPWSSKGWPEDAVSWFQDSAQSFVSRMYDLVAILREHGIQVQVFKTRKLFKVLYDDDFQVVAVDRRF